MSVIYVLLVAHFVGDFLCQSDWMALNKSKSWWALTMHVGVYTSMLMLAMGYAQQEFWSLAPWLWLAVNALAHFAQDAITSRINARLWFIRWHQWGTLVQPVGGGGTRYVNTAEVLPTRHWFFVGIGADQLLHYVTLFVTAGWWLR